MVLRNQLIFLIYTNEVILGPPLLCVSMLKNNFKITLQNKAFKYEKWIKLEEKAQILLIITF